jgi:hypothetical protein
MTNSPPAPLTSTEHAPHKLTAGEKHILTLIQRGADADGWAPVSKAVKPLFVDKKIPCGTMPTALCEFEAVGEGGRARLTTLGKNLLEAMLWL